MVIEGEEAAGLRSLLSMLSKPDLFSLASTITNGFVKTCDEQDAINSIVTYAPSSLDVLKRRKLKKDILVNYLTQEKAVFNFGSDKLELIKICLDHWRSCSDPELIDYEMDDTDVNETQQSVNSCKVLDINLDVFGFKFGEWFYGILKDIYNESIFGVQHFWPDCIMRVMIGQKDDYITVDKSVNTSSETCQMIKYLTGTMRLHFDPNLYSDIRCEMSPQGLIRLTINGVVHSNCEPIGIFHHIFGLIKNPHLELEHDKINYKIKFMEMYLKLNKQEHVYRITNG